MVVLAVVLMMFSVVAEMDSFAPDVVNGMTFDPVEKVVDPPLSGCDLFFHWSINISTAYAVSAWEAKLLWDPAVLRLVEIDWGTFMTGADMGNSSVESSGQEWMLLSQNFIEQHTVTGDGVLATIGFTFVLPGVTQLSFLESKVWDDALIEYDLLPPSGGTLNGRVRSNRPHPTFTWKTDDGINPVPNHMIYDAGRSLSAGTVVHFDGSLSYDVGNIYWDGSNWARDVDYPDIVKYGWEYGDGKVDEYFNENLTYLTDHMYASYKKEGYIVNLTVRDSENEWWSSTWRLGGPESANIIPMWRDVGIVDIWSSLPSYWMWDELGVDSLSSWWFDTVDYWIPYIWDPYYDYLVQDWSMWPKTVKQSWLEDRSAGLYVCVTVNNFGTVPERVNVKLFAQYLENNLKVAPPPASAVQNVGTELIGQWNVTIYSGSGTGWSCFTIWLPSENGSFLLFATVEAQFNAAIYDSNSTDNYFIMLRPICNEAVWNRTSLTLMTDSIFVQYMCDIDGSGKVGPEDFALLSSNFGRKPPKAS